MKSFISKNLGKQFLIFRRYGIPFLSAIAQPKPPSTFYGCHCTGSYLHDYWSKKNIEDIVVRVSESMSHTYKNYYRRGHMGKVIGIWSWWLGVLSIFGRSDCSLRYIVQILHNAYNYT